MPVLDSLMSNILITPAAANKPEELQDGIGGGPFVVTRINRGAGNYSLAQRASTGARPPASTGPGAVPARGVQPGHRAAQRRGRRHRLDHARLGEQLAGLPGVAARQRPSPRINQIFYNFRKPAGHPLANARVREALSYAIDGEHSLATC